MSAIEVPYLPISSFDEAEVCDKIEKAIPEGAGDSYETGNYGILFPEEGTAGRDVLLILHGIGMEKYFSIFQELEIPLDTFLQLSDYDLQEIGIDDANDRKTILKSLAIHKINVKDMFVSENHAEDLRIARNILNQLLFLQNYCAYVELQMKKCKLTDYRISWQETACTYLKAFITSSVTQAKILTRSLYTEGRSDHMIGKMIRKYNLPLPKQLEGKLVGSARKKSKSQGFLKVMIVVGFCSMALLTGKFLVKTK